MRRWMRDNRGFVLFVLGLLPDGNGGIWECLERSGILADWKSSIWNLIQFSLSLVISILLVSDLLLQVFSELFSSLVSQISGFLFG